MGHWSLEMTARGVTRDRLFPWFTDFSPEDVGIAKGNGVDLLLSRQVTREGNRVHVESEVLSRGKPTKYLFDAILHPETYSYDVKGSSPGNTKEDNRRYTFTDVPGIGTTVRVDCNFKMIGTGYKLADALGLVTREMKGLEERLMGAFLAQAEKLPRN